MGLFRRKRDKDAEAAVDTEQVSPAANQSDAQAPEAPELTGATAAQPRDDSASAAADRPAERAAHGAGEGAQASDEELGPYDARTLTSRAGLVDLGAILLPGIRGLVVSMEMDQNTGDVTAVRIHLGESQLQLQAFAAPKSSGIWDEIREEIAQALTAQGGSSAQEEGPFGAELVVRVPGRGSDGRAVTTAMRFIGIDRPRWFLRGVISGPAATDPQQAQPFIDLLHVTVVDRGHEPMAPRELLPLQLPPETPAETPAEAPVEAPADPAAGAAVPVGQGPTQPGQAPGQQGQPGTPTTPSTDDLRPFERGPEITEVR